VVAACEVRNALSANARGCDFGMQTGMHVNDQVILLAQFYVVSKNVGNIDVESELAYNTH
jgi:hypothetical protein